MGLTRRSGCPMISIGIANSPVSDADISIIKEILAQSKAKLEPTATNSDFFEFFSASHILRDYKFSPDDIKAGIVGQDPSEQSEATDGGIDSMYLIVGGKLIQDSEQAKDPTDHK